MMDLGVVRGLGTLVLFSSFVGLCIWAWSPAQRARFESASRLPFLDEDGGSVTESEEARHE